ncbi:hypothetical protein AADG42_02100 [Ammonicoccus fulvus]|uniref:Aminoglycoside phosphotransferase domain-containing protein n=1 Tax=Ammonicoccus fulvus TaxID=3138240 RepID=A0ABZ3FM35_9ACTN
MIRTPVLPTDAGVARAHRDLPALGVLLEPDRLAMLTQDLGLGAYTLDRLRLKPHASVTAVLRPVGGVGPWLLARGFAGEPWATKRRKDLDRAARLTLAAHEIPADRLVVVAAAADRSLPELARLKPDSGEGARYRRRGGGGTSFRGWFRTLSHNPARRWVGCGEAEDGSRVVVRVHADRPSELLPWQPGRPWQPGDPAPHGSWLPNRSGAQARNSRPRHPRVAERVNAAVRGLDMLSADWGSRAAAVADRIHTPLARVPLGPAHGDLTPDQVVVDDGHLHVLDWDEAGDWPLGWDTATWAMGLVLEGWPADAAGIADPAGTPVPTPEVRAAAAIMRGPEPFRRRHSHWAERTEALLAYAERVLS